MNNYQVKWKYVSINNFFLNVTPLHINKNWYILFEKIGIKLLQIIISYLVFFKADRI